MNRIDARTAHAHRMKRISLGRPSHSRMVLIASLTTVGLGSVPIQVAHAAPVQVSCKVDDLINAIGSAASGNFLSLTEGCIYALTVANNSDPSLGDNGLPVINITLTIKGNGATITRQQSTPAAPKFRIFQVAPGGDLTLSDLTVDNGDADSGSDSSANRFRKGRGGGVYNLGALKVINSTFSRNHASSGGGAIGNGDSTDFSPNPAAADLMLSDSVLFDNKADLGGAIAHGFTSTMNLTGSTISHNSGVTEGGGIGSQGKAILGKCTISGNSAGLGGGFVSAGQLFLTDSPVTGNTATAVTGSTIPTGFGGGILNSVDTGASATVTLTHSDVSGNSAANGGGGIVNGANGVLFGTATLIQSNVTGNNTTNEGGGILNEGHMTLTQSNVTGNNATLDGGGIANITAPSATPSNLTLTHSDVTDNKAGPGQHGGGIFNQTGNKITLDSSTVTGNTPDDF